MATPSCGHHFPWELQAFFLSKKGSQRSKNGGRTKKLRRSDLLSRSVFSTAGSFGWGHLWEISGSLESLTNQRKLFLYKVFPGPFGSWTSAPKSWTSAPTSAFFCGPGDGEKLFDPRASGRKGQERPREIRAKKLFLLPWLLHPACLSWSCGARFRCKIPESTTRGSTKNDLSELVPQSGDCLDSPPWRPFPH